MLNFAIVGYGGLGKNHFLELKDNRLDEIKLTAICDIDSEQFNVPLDINIGSSSQIPDLSAYNIYNDAEEMFEKEKLDFVVMALPTPLHEEYAIMALDKGIHVFSEKPMARTLEGCRNMIEAAKRNNKLLFIGQCLRFDDCYVELKKYIDSGKYGKLEQLDMVRRSGPPLWSWNNWYMDFEKSGGAALDLHVHDADFINYALGKPDAVYSVANHHIVNYLTISTDYIYENGPIVHAVGDWSMRFKDWTFQADFVAVFEKAACIANGDQLLIYPEDGEKFIVHFENGAPSCYRNEVNYFVDCILGKHSNGIIPPESAMQTIEIVLAEMESAKTGQVIKM